MDIERILFRLKRRELEFKTHLELVSRLSILAWSFLHTDKISVVCMEEQHMLQALLPVESVQGNDFIMYINQQDAQNSFD